MVTAERAKKTTAMKNKETIVRRTLVTGNAGLHVRESGDGEAPSRKVEGYAILFGVPSEPLWKDEDSEGREVIDSGAITKELLDGCDIKMTMFHDRQLILARSKQGKGTLSYCVDEKGVSFEFEAPNTVDGDKALELVRRGDLSGCSFAFTTRYWDKDFVERSVVTEGMMKKVTYTVRAVTGIYDFTLAADPAYPETSVEAREFVADLKDDGKPGQACDKDKDKEREELLEQVRDMRRVAMQKL